MSMRPTFVDHDACPLNEVWAVESEVLGDICSGFVDLTARPRFYVGQREVFGSQKLEELTRSGGSRNLFITVLSLLEAKRLDFVKTMGALCILSALCLMGFYQGHIFVPSKTHHHM